MTELVTSPDIDLMYDFITQTKYKLTHMLRGVPHRRERDKPYADRDWD